MLNRRSFLSAGAALTLIPPAKAQSLVEVSRSLTEEGRYLPLLHAMQAQWPANAAMRDPLAQVLAMTGDETAAMENIPARPLPLPDFADVSAHNALEAIVAAAKTRQIVILNEAHHISRCRAFAEALMEELRFEGFTVFAAETFTNIERAWPNAAMQALNSGAPITAALGWYLADPVYAELVRAARKLGYRFVSYEMRPDQLANAGNASDRQREVREDAEANNIIAHVLDGDPKAKIFIYCGYDHVLKSEVEAHQLWFAARLKAKTGIDPLCIGQAWTVPPPVGLAEEDGLQALLDHFRPASAIILRHKSGEPLRLTAPNKALDFEVIHHRASEVNGRPGWLAAATGRKEVHFKLAEVPLEGALLQAIPALEKQAPGVIPADQYPAPENVREANFYLKPGDYEVRLETDETRIPLGTVKV